MNRKQRRALKALGVTMPTPRKEEDIRNEYLQVCAQAGELQFKIGQMQAALTEVNGKLSALNQEYVDLKSNPPAPEAPSVVQAESA